MLVYRGDAELLLLQYFARDLLRSGAVLLEMKANAKMSEQLSIGSFFFYNLTRATDVVIMMFSSLFIDIG